MKVKHITQYLFESYKDAQAKFAQEASEDEVKQYLDTFKELTKKGTVSGQEKDIGYWIKQGWNEFKGFLDSKSQEKSKSQVKKSKKSGSIIAYEDDEKMVVIPLTKDASCYYGKNTKWCTAYTESDNQFVNYFYLNNMVLFYVFIKHNGAKYAAAYSKDKERFEFNDELDEKLKDDEFVNSTGIGIDQLKYWYKEHRSTIEKARDINKLSEDIQLKIIKKVPSRFLEINNPSEKLLIEAVKIDCDFIKNVDNPSEQVQLETMKVCGTAIIFLDNPSDRVKLEAVLQHGAAIQYIDNPTEKMKLEAVKNDSEAIQYIKNPSEELKLEAVKQNGNVIKYINNPSEQVKLEAVKQNSTAINYINNPSEELKLEAVKHNGYSIRFIDKPSEKLQSLAIDQDTKFIALINDPTEKMKLKAIENSNRRSLVPIMKFIKNPTEEMQLKAIEKTKTNFDYIDNPTDKAKKLKRELWGT